MQSDEKELAELKELRDMRGELEELRAAKKELKELRDAKKELEDLKRLLRDRLSITRWVVEPRSFHDAVERELGKLRHRAEDAEMRERRTRTTLGLR